MNIAFCINSLGLAGLGVTVSSLIRNCSEPNKLKIWFFGVDLSLFEKNKIDKLLKTENFSGTYNFVDFDPKSYFGKYSSLHGDWTAYGRLLLADFLNESQVLYLDADLVIELDVLELASFNFEGHFLAAVSHEVKVGDTLDKDFYVHTLKFSPDLDNFNSGVLLINLDEWRLKNVKEQCLKLAEQYPLAFKSHDQSLLNGICAGDFARLPKKFNCLWYPEKTAPTISSKMILHFAGSPKPWDPFGFVIHSGNRTWMKYLNPEWKSFISSLDFSNYKRAWHIRRSYLRTILNKVRG